MWLSDGTTGTQSMRIGGNTINSYGWQLDLTGTTANVFKSPNLNPNQNIFEILGSAGQAGNYFAVTSNGGSVGNIFNVAGNGNVGIGTTTPTAKLEVVGRGSTSGTASLWVKNLREIQDYTSEMTDMLGLVLQTQLHNLVLLAQDPQLAIHLVI